MSTFSDVVRSLTSLKLGTGSITAPADAIAIVPLASSNLLTIRNAAMGQATTLTIPDGGSATDTVVTEKASATTITGTTISAGKSGTAGSVKIFPATAAKGDLKITCSNQTGNTEVTVNAAAMGQATVLTIPDGGSATDTFVTEKAYATTINSTGITAGKSATAGTVTVYPTTASKGALALTATNNTGNTTTTITNSPMAQTSTISIPDPGGATSKFVIENATASQINVNALSVGGVPLPYVDTGNCSITAAAGAANTATVTIQLKDGSGVNIARSIPFMVHASSTSNGLTLASAASTGFSVASGGLSLNNGAAVTTSIRALSSASGACVLSLLDTAKQTSYLVLSLPTGVTISAQLTSGSYG